MVDATESITKTELRNLFRLKRKNLAALAEQKQQAEQAICRNILSLIPDQTQLVFSYMAFGDEVSLAKLCELRPDVEWAFPYVDGDDLQFYVPEDNQAFVKSSWGILEPDPQRSRPVSYSQCQMMLTPGLAFDRSGHRLGYGRAFYDRVLAHCCGTKVGVAFSVQLSEENLPTEAHDQSVDVIVTEKFIFKPLNNNSGGGRPGAI